MEEGLYLPTRLSKQSLSKEIALKDTVRDEELLVNVHYPRPENGKSKHHFEHVKFPIVLLSPLALGGKDCYKNFAQNIATSGYVCIVISHQDNIKLQRKTKGMGWLLKEGGPKKAIGNIYNTPHYSFNRICDILFVVKSLRIIELSIVHLRNHLIYDQIAIIGHSFGAFTAMLAAGVRVDIAPSDVESIPSEYAPITHQEPSGRVLYSWKVPNLRACIIISPLGTNFFGLTEDSFVYNVPCLFFTGSKDASFGKEYSADWKHQPFALAKADGMTKYMVDIYGVDHGFGDIAGLMIVSTMAGWKKDDYLISFLYRTSTAFLDANLYDNEEAKSWLAHGLVLQRYASTQIKTGREEVHPPSIAAANPAQEISPAQQNEMPANSPHRGSGAYLSQSATTVTATTSAHHSVHPQVFDEIFQSQQTTQSQQQSQMIQAPVQQTYEQQQPFQTHQPQCNQSSPQQVPQQAPIPIYAQSPPANGNTSSSYPSQTQYASQQHYRSTALPSQTQAHPNRIVCDAIPQSYRQHISQDDINTKPYQPRTVDHKLAMEDCLIPPAPSATTDTSQYAYLSNTTQLGQNPRPAEGGNTQNEDVPAYLRFTQ